MIQKIKLKIAIKNNKSENVVIKLVNLDKNKGMEEEFLKV